MTVKFRLSGRQHAQLADHLFPPDGGEAVAVALCGRRSGDGVAVLAVHELMAIPYDACSERSAVSVSWPTSYVRPLLEKAMKRDMAIVKIHSHRGDFPAFSQCDDASDRDLFASVYGWMDRDLPHGSIIMMPDGRMIGRLVEVDQRFRPVDMVAVAGDDVKYWPLGADESITPGFARRNAQAFGERTVRQLGQLSAGIVGCSGTGSPVVEMLARLGVGGLVLVDPDTVEEKNLNRIVNATMQDARNRKNKVDVAADAVIRMGLGTVVTAIPENLLNRRAVETLAECDVLFGCMDGAEGRSVLNRLATYYSIPYFDVGVRLEADGQGGISQICGGVHFLQPGESSLISRGVITSKQIADEGVRRTDPRSYEEQVKLGYIRGALVGRPAVISVNMHYASMAVNEFLARLHGFRDDENASVDWLSSSLTQVRFVQKTYAEPCAALSKVVGRGDAMPLLGMPSLCE